MISTFCLFCTIVLGAKLALGMIDKIVGCLCLCFFLTLFFIASSVNG